MVLNFLKSSYKKVKDALTKTRSLLGNKLKSLFSKKIDQNTLDDLEQTFYESDLGLKASRELTQKIKEIYAKNPSLDGNGLIDSIKKEMILALSSTSNALNMSTISPTVILVVGVNGNGKTTTVAKLASLFKNENKKVLVAAADTFRAAAMEQLETWAHRLNVEIVKGQTGSDPAAVVFDALNAAIARKSDVVIIDTAGRLHTKTNLMQELEKIRKICQKIHPNSPHETLLILDATTGQNAIDQAKTFHQFTPISGLILTKLDGTAKGGIVFSIYKELGIPVKFIGVGENLEDLEPFHPENFVNALFD